MNRFVITISRSCGSGGVAVGRAVAKKLGIEYYDSKLLKLASDDSGISEELFAGADEKLKKTLLFKVSRKIYNGELIPPESSDFTSCQNLFNYQAKVIRSLAEASSCVIIGRCSEFILANDPGLLSVFIDGSKDRCAKREAADHAIKLKAAYEKTERINKYRYDFHKYYTGMEWGHPGNYDLCLSTDSLSYDACADIIISALKRKLADNMPTAEGEN